MRQKLLLLIVAALLASPAWAEAPADLMTSADLANFGNPAADARIHYGDGALQFGDLRVPPGKGPLPTSSSCTSNRCAATSSTN